MESDRHKRERLKLAYRGKVETDSMESDRHKGEKLKLTIWNLTGIKGKS